ncbi:hypothetical protein T492DRAFT_204910 [Pavlovales sp. CCMP2436]|nr:hypothetical protein T492DRAFT_204910 [Pavlovales sp. CCMP2436]|mmetsp:Transcript_43688/g.102549  ORF Transcript_43688/g.102549 Transcript_43688/m.102549 type:complete len:184 (+) Transcript_43688:1265-1816(+)
MRDDIDAFRADNKKWPQKGIIGIKRWPTTTNLKKLFRDQLGKVLAAMRTAHLNPTTAARDHVYVTERATWETRGGRLAVTLGAAVAPVYPVEHSLFGAPGRARSSAYHTISGSHSRFFCEDSSAPPVPPDALPEAQSAGAGSALFPAVAAEMARLGLPGSPEAMAAELEVDIANEHQRLGLPK